MEQLACNQTFKRILATLLTIGNFLNGSNVRTRSSACDSLLFIRKECVSAYTHSMTNVFPRVFVSETA